MEKIPKMKWSRLGLTVVRRPPKRGVRGSNPPGDGRYKRELLAGTAE